MTNNQLCKLLCVLGLLTLSLGMGLMFFGVSVAWVAVVAGGVTATVGTISFD